jgi:thiamine-monophosphate kinase
LTEDSILDQVRRKVKLPRGSELVAGIGDDCAVVRPRGLREDLLFTTDLLLENVHFRRATHPPEVVGRKALARGLSDIAAMGGEPRFCLLSLVAPRWADQAWIRRFYDGWLEFSEQTHTPLAGGDLARGKNFVCDIVVAGTVPRGQALMRSGAKPGDSIYVSGALGGSALGLRTRKGPAWKRHLKPEPRIELGRYLRRRLRATAAMDLSDGLSRDLHRMCLASRVSAEIEPPPVFPGASLEDALDGGEDYELLFTVSPRIRVPARYKGLPLTRIGSIHRGRAGAVFLSGRPLAVLGYDHFSRT